MTRLTSVDPQSWSEDDLKKYLSTVSDSVNPCLRARIAQTGRG
jgi:hypothetical protein